MSKCRPNLWIFLIFLINWEQQILARRCILLMLKCTNTIWQLALTTQFKIPLRKKHVSNSLCGCHSNKKSETKHTEVISNYIILDLNDMKSLPPPFLAILEWYEWLSKHHFACLNDMNDSWTSWSSSTPFCMLLRSVPHKAPGSPKMTMHWTESMSTSPESRPRAGCWTHLNTWGCSGWSPK